MTTTTAQTAARELRELGNLRVRWTEAAAAGEIERGERMTLVEATLERMGELVEAGMYAQAKRIHQREFEGK